MPLNLNQLSEKNCSARSLVRFIGWRRPQAFAYTVFDPTDATCLGCFYINPATKVRLAWPDCHMFPP